MCLVSVAMTVCLSGDSKYSSSLLRTCIVGFIVAVLLASLQGGGVGPLWRSLRVSSRHTLWARINEINTRARHHPEAASMLK